MAGITNPEVKVGAMVEDHTKMEHDIKTMEGIKDTFKDDFMDEVHDSNKYLKMAHTAEVMGHEELAEGLYEMAHDEYTHAKFIHLNLVDWGCDIPEKEMMKWHELEEHIARKFRD